MSTIHLLSGLPCSGKTTYSRKLVAERGGVHFCLDYWLINLFGKYSIDGVGRPEHTRRVLACRSLIWDVAEELLKKGSDVILDDGFFFREHRMACIDRAKRAGSEATIHFLDVPKDVLRQRIVTRNSDLPEFNFIINPDLLDSFDQLFERPGHDEGAGIIISR
ncbi:MAG: AAA family ATPase [Deltaproteobacteria bacterium]|nr:AAA family ATPase [Deltaproteobacteria bacterium]